MQKDGQPNGDELSVIKAVAANDRNESNIKIDNIPIHPDQAFEHYTLGNDSNMQQVVQFNQLFRIEDLVKKGFLSESQSYRSSDIFEALRKREESSYAYKTNPGLAIPSDEQGMECWNADLSKLDGKVESYVSNSLLEFDSRSNTNTAKNRDSYERFIHNSAYRDFVLPTILPQVVVAE